MSIETSSGKIKRIYAGSSPVECVFSAPASPNGENCVCYHYNINHSYSWTGERYLPSPNTPLKNIYQYKTTHDGDIANTLSGNSQFLNAVHITIEDTENSSYSTLEAYNFFALNSFCTGSKSKDQYFVISPMWGNCTSLTKTIVGECRDLIFVAPELSDYNNYSLYFTIFANLERTTDFNTYNMYPHQRKRIWRRRYLF